MEWKTRFKYGSYAFLTTIVMVTIVLVLNLIASKSNWTIDFTQNRLYSLSTISKNVISNINKEIKVSLAYDSIFEKNIKQLDEYTKDRQGIEKLLNKYGKLNSNIKIDSFDINKNPELVEKYGISSDSYISVVIQSEDKIKVLKYADIYTLDSTTYQTKFVGEQKITNAIKNITSDKKANVYYLNDHESYTNITEIDTIMTELNDTNYKIAPINLKTELMPVDTDILLILALSEDLTQEELNKIEAYMNTGGKVFITLVPSESNKFPILTRLLNKSGITTNYDAVFETNEDKIYYTELMFYADIEDHIITNSIKTSGYNVIMPGTTNIGILEETNGYEVKTLLKSSSDSYSKNIDSLLSGEDTAKKTNDKSGPFNLATVSTKTIEEGKESKIVVLGSTYLLQPQYSVDYNETIVNKSANIDIILNSLAWLKGAEDEISLRPKITRDSTILMTKGNISTMVWFTVLVIPSVILLVGFIVWYRRRRGV